MNEFPRDTEMERHLLSALFLEEGSAIPAVAAILQPDDFFAPENRLIYEGILAVADSGAPPHLLTVRAELEKRGVFKHINHMYFISLPDAEYSNALATSYAKKIKDASRRRRLIELCKAAIYDAGTGEKTADELIGKVEQMSEVLTATIEPLWKKPQDELLQEYNELRERKQSGKMQGVTTGFYDLNKLTGGLKKSELIILAARPSMGKTALALNIALAASRKIPVLIFSLEMSRVQLRQRILSTVSGVDLSKIWSGRVSDDEQQSIADALAPLSEWDWCIDDTAGLSIAELKMRARQYKHVHGLGLIVVDYLQLIQGSKEYRGNRVQEVSEISLELKNLARELDVPVLALSQLSRNVELRAEKIPQLSDLRDSGSIEQDADIVMFLYREDYYDRDTDNKGIAQVIIAKNRNGATGATALFFKPKIVCFFNATKVED